MLSTGVFFVLVISRAYFWWREGHSVNGILSVLVSFHMIDCDPVNLNARGEGERLFNVLCYVSPLTRFSDSVTHKRVIEFSVRLSPHFCCLAKTEFRESTPFLELLRLPMGTTVPLQPPGHAKHNSWLPPRKLHYAPHTPPWHGTNTTTFPGLPLTPQPSEHQKCRR